MKHQEQNSFLATDTGLILKMFALATVTSVAIKFIGPGLAIPATNRIVLIAVLLPSLLIGLALIWRGWQQYRQS